MLLRVVVLSVMAAVAMPLATQSSAAQTDLAVSVERQCLLSPKLINICIARRSSRGTTLFKDAKSPDDYKQVIDEFSQATTTRV